MNDEPTAIIQKSLIVKTFRKREYIFSPLLVQKRAAGIYIPAFQGQNKKKFITIKNL